MAFKPFPLKPRCGAIHFIKQEIKEKKEGWLGGFLGWLPPSNENQGWSKHTPKKIPPTATFYFGFAVTM